MAEAAVPRVVVAAVGVAAAGKLTEYLHEIEEKTMKKRILPVTIVWGVLFTSFVFAACEQSRPLPEPCLKAHPMPCDNGEETGMMIFCDKLKAHEDMKAVPKGALVLEEHSLNAPFTKGGKSGRKSTSRSRSSTLCRI